MNTLKLSGKHIYIEADLGKFYGGAYPFPLIMLLDDHVIVGMCWKKWSSGKLVGSPGDPYGVVQDLLDSVRFFMVAKPRRLVGVKPDTVREYGFQVGEDSSIYSATSVADSVFIFLERKNDVVKIHYYNQLLYETDCPRNSREWAGVQLNCLSWNLLMMCSRFRRDTSKTMQVS